MEYYEVKTTSVRRTTVFHRVFADSKAQAILLMMHGKAERVYLDERYVEKPKYDVRRVPQPH